LVRVISRSFLVAALPIQADALSKSSMRCVVPENGTFGKLLKAAPPSEWQRLALVLLAAAVVGGLAFRIRLALGA
jgi:hypothetical protein